METPVQSKKGLSNKIIIAAAAVIIVLLAAIVLLLLRSPLTNIEDGDVPKLGYARRGGPCRSIKSEISQGAGERPGAPGSPEPAWPGQTGTASISNKASGTALTLQIGDTSDSFNQMKVSVGDMHTKAMGIDGIDISNQTGAAGAVQTIKDAINYVSGAVCTRPAQSLLVALTVPPPPLSTPLLSVPARLFLL